MKVSTVPWHLLALVLVAGMVFVMWGAVYSQGSWWFIPFPSWLPFPLFIIAWQFWRWSLLWGPWTITLLLPRVLARAGDHVRSRRANDQTIAALVLLGGTAIVVLEALVIWAVTSSVFFAALVFPVTPITVGLLIPALRRMREGDNTTHSPPILEESSTKAV